MANTTRIHGPGFEDDETNSPHLAPEPSALPMLTNEAKAYPGCCLALSMPLVQHIHSLLPPFPALTLSIGSGYGLLEAHLLALPQQSHLVGVEVEPTPNQYLSSTNHRVVHGTRFLQPLAAEAATWLFVYPRRVGLISEYLDNYGEAMVQQIIWIGPRADWDDYAGCFTNWNVRIQIANEVGGKAWDMIAVAKIR